MTTAATVCTVARIVHRELSYEIRDHCYCDVPGGQPERSGLRVQGLDYQRTKYGEERERLASRQGRRQSEIRGCTANLAQWLRGTCPCVGQAVRGKRGRVT